MMDQKLLRQANGRKFRIQATSRQNGRITVLHHNLSAQQCEAYEPRRDEKKEVKYFRLAYNESK